MRDEDAPAHLAGAATPALIEAELARVALSAPFRRSPRHMRFLRHLVLATLAGDDRQLREMTLGVDVFLRNAQRFDPRHDTIVRVEARRLRQKLALYYADEGLDARLEFRLPVGSYHVAIRRRETVLPALRGRNSVAVHALRHDDPEAAFAPLVAALSAELAAAVARLNGLRVVQAGAAPADDGQALRRARQLKVDSLVLGTASLQGGQLLVQLRLLRSDDGTEMWARRAQLDPALALQGLEPLARGIISALHRDAAQRQLQRIQLSGGRPYLHVLAGGGPTPQAMETLSLARVAMRANTLDGYRKAVQLAEAATAAMPGFAGAYSLLAEALVAVVGMTLLPSRPTLESARRAAERALELDAELADAHGLLGYLLFVDGHDWPAAEARLLESIRLAPAAASAHARYGWALMMNRRYAEARAAYAEARDLDPDSMLYRCHEALIDVYEHHWERAAERLDELIDVSPQHVLALALRAALDLYAGAWPQALAAYEDLGRRHPGLSIGRCGQAQAQALLGDTAAARDGLQRLEQAYAEGWVSPYQIAMVQARLDDPAAALQWLAEAARRSDFNFVCVAVDPAFDGLRDEPAFGALLRDHGFGHLVGSA